MALILATIPSRSERLGSLVAAGQPPHNGRITADGLRGLRRRIRPPCFDAPCAPPPRRLPTKAVALLRRGLLPRAQSLRRRSRARWGFASAPVSKTG